MRTLPTGCSLGRGDRPPTNKCCWLILRATRPRTAGRGETYRRPAQWNSMALLNIARSGIFAADRAIRDYARDIWRVPVKE